MSNKKQITVIGATGNLGAPVVKNLANLGYFVKAIVRNKEKAERIFGSIASIEIFEADLKGVETLRKGLSGTTYLYLSLSTNTTDRNISFAAEREGVANILEALDRESIKQIISISGLGAFDNTIAAGGFQFIPNIIRKEGHKLIKKSGIPYTILHCSSFIDNFILYQRKGSYSVIGNTKFPIYFTNCYDYSLQLAHSIGNPDAMYKEFPIQGKDGLLHVETAEKFLSVYQDKPKVNILPGWMIGMMSFFIKEMKFVKHMADYFSHSPEEFLAEDNDTFKVLGEPKMELEEYALMLRREGFYGYLGDR